jgi:hypothetical protein
MLHRKIWKKLHRHHDIFISWHHYDQSKAQNCMPMFNCRECKSLSFSLERNGETSNENNKASSISYLVPWKNQCDDCDPRSGTGCLSKKALHANVQLPGMRKPPERKKKLPMTTIPGL